MIALALMAAGIGLVLGLLGGGGSILAVPVLIYGAGLGPREAIAASLLVVGTASLVALLQHARRGNVAWRTGLVFAGTAMVGAYLGGRAAGWFSGTTLLLLFAGMMVATALAMFRGRADIDRERESSASLPVMAVIAEGLVVGAATGLVGAGGGFLVVPALVLMGNMDMRRAVGTSLLVIALKSFAAYAGHAAEVDLELSLIALITAVAVAGTFVGVRFGRRLPAAALRRGFAGFVLLMAGYIFWRETDLTGLPWATLAVPLLAISTLLALWALARWRGHREVSSRASV